MGYTYDTAAAKLGISRATYARMVAGKGIDRRTALACAAIAAELGPWDVSSRKPHKTVVVFTQKIPTNQAATRTNA